MPPHESEPDRIERELNERRERLRITLASIGDAVISTDAEGRVVFLNGVAEALTGWTQAEALGRPLREVFHIINEDTRELVENPVQRALTEGRVVALANHTLLVARDGTARPIEDSAAPMRGESGAIIGVVLVFRDVTERKRAEEERAQLAAIVESSSDAIVSKTLDGVIRTWNAGATRLFGYEAAEVIGKSITILVPAERADEEPRILERLRGGERVDHFETVRVTKDGRRLDISLTISPIRDREGRIIGASKIARDITAQTQAMAALRASEARHRFLGELTAATQALTDPAEILTTTARRLAEHLGVERCAYAEIEDDAFVITGDHSRGVPSIVGRWPIAAFGTACAQAMATNEAFVVEDVDQDPRLGPAERPAYRQTNIQAVICVPLHKAQKLTAAMAVHQTRPRRWTAEERSLVETVVARSWESLERLRVSRGLAETADRLALALVAARLGDWSWELASDLVDFSPRAAEIFGVPPGRNTTWAALRERLHEEDRERVIQAVERSLADRTRYDVDYRVRRGDDIVWVSAKGSAQYGPGGEALGMFGVVQDITQQKRLEEELVRRAAELAEADRKKDEFIALLAHELRNPLAPVRTGLQVMRLAAGDQNAVAKARAMMDRQLAHMVRLIDDLLDVSRINRSKLHLQKGPVLLAEAVSHALEATSPAIEAAGHHLEVDLPAEPIALDADLTRLAQVFGNLLTNSAKYTNAGGHIWLGAKVHGGEVVVTVRDDGIGIPAEALPRVFDMFSQVDRSLDRASGGLGIGLALVKGLVEAHGGRVSAASGGIGKGSTFTVRLPLAHPATAAGRADAKGRARQGSARRILVADDNEDGAAIMAELLELLGHEVHLAADGVEAVEAADRLRPDLVLMDVGMPRLGGLDATRRIREQPWGSRMKIVALTGWGQDRDRQQSRDAGCDGHLVKPVSLANLEQLLAELA